MTLSLTESSACIEMLFPDLPDPVQRIHAARAAGFGAVEFWLWSDKDLPALAAARQATGLAVTGFCAEPTISLNDPANHAEFLKALPASIASAQMLGASSLFLQGGSTRPGVSAQAQTDSLITILAKSADILQGSGVTLLLEPVSDADEGFLTHAAHGFDIVAAVNRPEVRLLYDLFHAAVAGEDLRATAAGKLGLIGHVHLADHPGRGAPGTGALDLDSDIAWLRAQGYRGRFGLEYYP